MAKSPTSNGQLAKRAWRAAVDADPVGWMTDFVGQHGSLLAALAIMFLASLGIYLTISTTLVFSFVFFFVGGP